MPRPDPMPRPYGPDAPWNIPVDGLPLDPQSALYASRWWNYASDNPGNYNLRAVTFTYPVFYSSDAIGSYVVGSGVAGNMAGKSMPWNPAWSNAVDPELGSDGQIVVIDESNGREYNLWQVSSWNGSTIQATRCTMVQTGTELQGTSSSSPANYLTKENGWQPSRGVGIQYLAMLVRPEEIIAGEILHALSAPVRNPSNMFAVPPATKLEHCNGQSTGPLTCSGPDGSNPIPEGMRFAHTRSDAQIETWVATKSANYRNLARTVARALRDYGWFITDTSGAAGWQMEANITSLGLWGAGVDSTGSTFQNLMDGLFTQADVVAFVPSNQYPVGNELAAAEGVFLMTGRTAGLQAGRKMVASPGSFSMTGTAVGLNNGFTLQADRGVFLEEGIDVGLELVRNLDLVPGSFAMTGRDAILSYSGGVQNFVIQASPGAFNLVAQDISLDLVRNLDADPGAYAMAGVDVTFTRGVSGGELLSSGTTLQVALDRKLAVPPPEAITVVGTPRVADVAAENRLFNLAAEGQQMEVTANDTVG